MTKAILASLLISLFVASCGKSNSSGKGHAGTTPGVSPVFPANTAPDELMDQVNQRRGSWGLPPLNRDADLDAQAQAFAYDLADGRNVRFHDQANLCERVRRPGDCAYMVRSDIRTAVGVVGVWMRTPERLENLQSRRLTRAGAAVALDRENRPIWVLLMTTN